MLTVAQAKIFLCISLSTNILTLFIFPLFKKKHTAIYSPHWSKLNQPQWRKLECLYFLKCQLAYYNNSMFCFNQFNLNSVWGEVGLFWEGGIVCYLNFPPVPASHKFRNLSYRSSLYNIHWIEF